MGNLMKQFWFKRLPVLRMNAAAWDSHIALHWNMDLIRTQIAMPTKEVRLLLDRFMPELLPEFESLLSVSPDRPGQAQLLAMYNLPPFFSGCSNSVSHRLGHQTLIRNYDFGFDEFSGVFRYEPLSDGGWIIGSAERLRSIPHRLVQNISLLDRQGRYSVVYISPKGVTIDQGLICCTNHQPQIQESAHVEHQTVERFDHLFRMAGAVSPEDFLKEPLYNRRFSDNFGTLYTVEIDPISSTVHYHWPDGKQLVVSSRSPETEFSIPLSGS